MTTPGFEQGAGTPPSTETTVPKMKDWHVAITVGVIMVIVFAALSQKSGGSSQQQEDVAEEFQQTSAAYDYGYDYISGLSGWELESLFIYRFIPAGDNKLNNELARDWCGQLPKIVIGLTNKVGFPADPDFVEGCSKAAMELRF